MSSTLASSSSNKSSRQQAVAKQARSQHPALWPPPQQACVSTHAMHSPLPGQAQVLAWHSPCPPPPHPLHTGKGQWHPQRWYLLLLAAPAPHVQLVALPCLCPTPTAPPLPACQVAVVQGACMVGMTHQQRSMQQGHVAATRHGARTTPFGCDHEQHQQHLYIWGCIDWQLAAEWKSIGVVLAAASHPHGPDLFSSHLHGMSQPLKPVPTPGVARSKAAMHPFYHAATLALSTTVAPSDRPLHLCLTCACAVLHLRCCTCSAGLPALPPHRLCAYGGG